MIAAQRTAAFMHWRGGARWHHRQAGYTGHLVQVVDNFGDLVAVRGRLKRAATAKAPTGTSQENQHHG